MAEASEQFKQQVRAAFDELRVGQEFTYRRTFTDGDVALFCGITGDFNPYHQDDLFARETWFGRRIVPGLLTASMLTHVGGMLGFLAREMSFQFVAAVFVGDTVTCTLTVTDKDEQARLIRGSARCVNQRGDEVLRGTFGGFPSLIRLSR